MYFNLDPSFFFDEYLRTVDKIPHILKSYREKNNLTLMEACTKFNVNKKTWIYWEHNKTKMSRSSFKKLKEHNIL